MDELSRQRVYMECIKWTDRYENEMLPAAEVTPLDLQFGCVRLMERYVRHVRIMNVGKVQLRVIRHAIWAEFEGGGGRVKFVNFF